MKRTELLQEIRTMRFEEVYDIWTEKHVTQGEAARMLGVCERTFRRYVNCYHDNGLEGLLDKRLTQASARKAPVDEGMALVDRYKDRYNGWSVKHYYSWYRRTGGRRSYTWVKNILQQHGAVPKRGAHRKRRERAPIPGMLLHQDGSTHQWGPGQLWDLIVTMDDATGEHYGIFFVDEEGTWSSFRGLREVVLQHGVHRPGSHYWHTPEAGGKVDKKNLTQFGQAMHHLGIEMIAAYSPEARGRSERAFQTHQGRLVKELALHNITTMEAANRYLKEVYLPAFNEEFTQPPATPESAYIPWIGGNLS